MMAGTTASHYTQNHAAGDGGNMSAWPLIRA
jgi:hypothetical protein